MAAAGCVLEAAVFDLGGVVRVPGAGAISQCFIITGVGIVIVDHGGNWRAAGKAIQNAAEKFGAILFLAGCGPVMLPRCPAVQELLQFLQVNGQPRRDPVQGHADGGTVGLAENG